METRERRNSDKHGQVQEYEEYEEADKEEEENKVKESETLAYLKGYPEKETESKNLVRLPLFRKKRVRCYFRNILHVIEKLSSFLIGGELKNFFRRENLFPLTETVIYHLKSLGENISNGN